MSTQIAPTPERRPAGTPGCKGDHNLCPHPVVAKGLCAAHYRRNNRGGKITEPVHQHRGELVSLSLRITKDAAKELDRAGGGYAKGAEVLEEWAKRQRDQRRGSTLPA